MLTRHVQVVPKPIPDCTTVVIKQTAAESTLVWNEVVNTKISLHVFIVLSEYGCSQSYSNIKGIISLCLWLWTFEINVNLTSDFCFVTPVVRSEVHVLWQVNFILSRCLNFLFHYSARIKLLLTKKSISFSRRYINYFYSNM